MFNDLCVIVGAERWTLTLLSLVDGPTRGDVVADGMFGVRLRGGGWIEAGD